MELSVGLNLIGLLLITFGSISAAKATPAPKYNPDGSVSLVGEPDKKKRIAMYKRQKRFPKFLSLIGIGALIQAFALLLEKFY
ncbi:hypothetical protein [Microbulbifer discodermiae]|uniref:hypothetical protein n=1 Tax=Microbulbifer sp. 2201CG32-9 TaxID=3232309 RepID=UPI00345C5D3E